MAENWDRFEAFKVVQKKDFAFRPTRFETWIGGEMVGSGNATSILTARVITQSGSEKMAVSFNERNLKDEISSELIFDEFVTANDRLQLITIPNETNSENVAIMMFKMTIGATRQQKNFASTEPYCCNIFLKNGVISKITFSFSNPEKLVELYQENHLDLNFVFKSYDHLRYENGRHVSGPHGGANRAVKVEPNISGGEGYTVTLYNLDGNHPIWHNNVQMAPKQMKIIQRTNDKVVLRGYGYDAMGGSFADYGLSIHFMNGSVKKCILHMHDRNVDIEYLKSEDQSLGKSNSPKNDFEEIQSFLIKFKSLPMNIKKQLAQKTDELNNIGVEFYENDDIENAIIYYIKALEIYPINDDALNNLTICYRETNNFKKMEEAQTKLDYIKRLGI